MQKKSLSDHLASLKERSLQGKVPLGEIQETFGNKGFGILLVCLSLPSALPIPAAGYSTPFGLILCILGLQMIVGVQKPWLPQRARQLSLNAKMVEMMSNGLNKFFKITEHFIKPRLKWLNTRTGHRLLGILVVIMSLLMILPIPLTNTAPGAVIFLLGVGMSEGDGFFAIGACLVGLLAVTLYAFVIYFAITLIQEHGWEGLELLKENVKAFIKSLLG